jgi:hypothetical protein
MQTAAMVSEASPTVVNGAHWPTKEKKEKEEIFR